MITIAARNVNLERHLNGFIKNKRLRWQYLRDKNTRNKIGCLISFVEQDPLTGRKEMYVGYSKVNKTHDIFELDLGLTKAIDNAVPFADFLYLYENEKLPKVPPTWKNVRDEQGYITGEVEWYNQYENFVGKLTEVYSKVIANYVSAGT